MDIDVVVIAGISGPGKSTLANGNFITENGFVATYMPSMPPQTYGLTLNYSFGGGR